MPEFVNKLIPTIITVALTAAVVWFIISSNQSNMPIDLQAKIDSLSQLDKQFAIQQRKLDSSIHVDEEYVQNLDTKIGVNGLQLSGGQKQRVLIARAVYKQAAYFIFDEATSSLDTENEAQIMRNLHQYFTGKTVVLVAHRLSTVKNADQILVMHEGCLAEQGTHDDLLENKGKYYDLIKNQLV